MVAVKGKFDGVRVTLDRAVQNVPKCEVIVTFLEPPLPAKAADNGSLSYLFAGYADDGVREPMVDFGEAVGSEAR